MRNKPLLSLVAALMLTTVLAGAYAPGAEPLHARLGVFSWHEENVTDTRSRGRMFDTLRELGVNEVYQTLHERSALPFLEQAHDLGIDVFVLSGVPDWSLDNDAKAMVREVERVAAMRETLGDAGPAGLMLDVEPYLTREYSSGSKAAQEVMDTFLQGLDVTYARAEELDVTLLVCLPYWFDTKGFTEHIQTIIGHSSDGVALMNYMKVGEVENVKTEIAAALEHGKRFIHIYELQRPGIYGLTQRNTYHSEGLEGVFQNRQALLDAYDYEGLSFALHEYDALREILDRE